MSAKSLAQLALVLVALQPPARAQSLTLEDLAALQRAAIETEARRTPRAEATSPTAGPAVPAIAVIPNSHAPSTKPLTAPSIPPLGLPAVPPRLAVAGIAGAQGRWIVELATDTGPIALQVGDLIPGTAWRVVGLSPRTVRLERLTPTRPGRAPRKSHRLLEPGDTGPAVGD